ncbi:alba DNA/RNA-binding protein [Anaeramoeba flamelloides]|uniref:Alba DNA/RNA-binding protein n=1 Tax=Anaeramoeba flamelloides TaxID=1746091 RepID=A0ABQ8Y4M8_9EUKA|nr:alba DNA/RNA-binding protein [Anaeramoeba flamelloides]
MTDSIKNDNLIRISAKTRVINCVKYVKSLIENNSSEKLILLQATGSSMNKAITIFEILKREVMGISGDIQLDKIPKPNSKNSNSSLKLSRVTISLKPISTEISKEKDINQNIQTKKSMKKKQKKNIYLRLGEEKKEKYFVRK